ncbi:MAG: putative toxin-antitoxin system toxin component, PIN family [Desulfobacterales bacterium]|nr:putative toxin-antitoxin system toxin component, PIN family [Desulfobacterales bacterium]
MKKKTSRAVIDTNLFISGLFAQKGYTFKLQELWITKAFIVTKDRYKTNKIKKDQTDNKFLSCALEAKADFIVSGDNHLLELKHYHGIQIVTAKIFVNKVTIK